MLLLCFDYFGQTHLLLGIEQGVDISEKGHLLGGLRRLKGHVLLRRWFRINEIVCKTLLSKGHNSTRRSGGFATGPNSCRRLAMLLNHTPQLRTRIRPNLRSAANRIGPLIYFLKHLLN